MAPSFARVGQEAAPKLTGTKYASVPADMRRSLRIAFEKACSTYTTAAVLEPAANYRTQYELKKAVLFRFPKHEPEITTISTGFAFVENANITLIDHVIDTRVVDFANYNAVECESSSAALELANPDYLDLHVLGKGDLGWGQDTFGCLSLCFLPELGAQESRLEAYFVQRVYGSGEAGPRSGGVWLSSDQGVATERHSFKFSMRLPTKVEKGKAKAKEEEDEDRLGRLLEESREKEEERKEQEFKASLLRKRVEGPKNPHGFQGQRY